MTTALIPGTPVLNLGGFDLTALGYTVEEFRLSGTAVSYSAVGEISADGDWRVTPDGQATFATRLVVVRPRDASAFNGAVVMEWLNVSGGLDAAPDWLCAHREIIRSGFAYVGVSVQKVGIDGGPSLGLAAQPLKQADPARYRGLEHPGDAFAYDIFSQAGAAVRQNDGGVLGELSPDRLLAVGESQSAMFLTTYVNAVDPLAGIYDGFMIHSRFGGAAGIDGATSLSGGGIQMPATVKLRRDLRAPVMTIITETDLVGGQLAGFLAARQPDHEKLRVWEIPGTAHADTYMLAAANLDSGSAPIADLAAALAATDVVLGAKLDKPINCGPQHHYVVASAVAHLDRWAGGGRPPPAADPIRTTADGLALDALGNAEGGVRTPWVDVPTARLSGIGNSGGALAFLVGATEAFAPESLSALYPGGSAQYIDSFADSLRATIAAGFMLEADETEALALAAALFPRAA